MTLTPDDVEPTGGLVFPNRTSTHAPAHNVELMKLVLKQVEHEPDRHDQSGYRYYDDDRCQTTLCIAGWAAQLAGGRWVLPDGPDVEVDAVVNPDDLYAEPEDDPDVVQRLTVDGRVIYVIEAHERAERVLGLTEDEATALFCAMSESHAIAKLRDMIREAEDVETAEC